MDLKDDIKKLAATAEFDSFVRSFFLQTGWNAERMQNLGFVFTLLPLMKDRHEKDMESAILRHLEFFNTHPYVAGALAAAVDKMERSGESDDSVRAFKQSMMGPFGALGDSFFWFSLKPVALLVGVTFAMAGNYLMAIVVPLLLYNTFNLWIRAWSFLIGVSEGRDLVPKITRFKFAAVNSLLGLFAACLIAFFSLFEVAGQTDAQQIQKDPLLSGGLIVAIVFLTAFAVKKGLKAEALIYLASAFGLFAAIAAV